MRVKIKFNNDDTFNLKNNKILMGFILVLGTVAFLFSFVQIFCLIVKPKGYEMIIQAGGGRYIVQFLMGAFFIGTYILIKKSNTVNKE